MEKRSGWNHLREDFPEFKVKNRTNLAKAIPLHNGEEVTVPGNAEVKLPSTEFMQIPDLRFFELKVPSANDLVEYDILPRQPDLPSPAPEDDDDEPKN